MKQHLLVSTTVIGLAIAATAYAQTSGRGNLSTSNSASTRNTSTGATVTGTGTGLTGTESTTTRVTGTEGGAQMTGTESTNTRITGTETSPNVNSTNGMNGAVTVATPLHSGGVSSTAMGWNNENDYWSKQYPSRPYHSNNVTYSNYAPAYHFGYDTYGAYGGKPYNQLDQTQLKTHWQHDYGNSGMTWEQAQPAMRDAYERMYNNRTGNAPATVTH